MIINYDSTLVYSTSQSGYNCKSHCNRFIMQATGSPKEPKEQWKKFLKILTIKYAVIFFNILSERKQAWIKCLSKIRYN